MVALKRSIALLAALAATGIASAGTTGWPDSNGRPNGVGTFGGDRKGDDGVNKGFAAGSGQTSNGNTADNSERRFGEGQQASNGDRGSHGGAERQGGSGESAAGSPWQGHDGKPGGWPQGNADGSSGGVGRRDEQGGPPGSHQHGKNWVAEGKAEPGSSERAGGPKEGGSGRGTGYGGQGDNRVSGGRGGIGRRADDDSAKDVGQKETGHPTTKDGLAHDKTDGVKDAIKGTRHKGNGESDWKQRDARDLAQDDIAPEADEGAVEEEGEIKVDDLDVIGEQDEEEVDPEIEDRLNDVYRRAENKPLGVYECLNTLFTPPCYFNPANNGQCYNRKYDNLGSMSPDKGVECTVYEREDCNKKATKTMGGAWLKIERVVYPGFPFYQNNSRLWDAGMMSEGPVSWSCTVKPRT